MKREIKFRAWDGERIIYLSDLSIGLKKSKRISPYAYFATDTFSNHVKLGKHELMQYTGLQDKNGKDIYEGDIVKCGDIIVAVTWKDAAFHIITNEAQGTSPFVQERARRFEVIGNIYENPELLNS